METTTSIRRTDDNEYMVRMSDGRFDESMHLVGTDLCPVWRHGFIRPAGWFRVKLGPKSLAIVKNLTIGQTVSI